jgi:hypothetical protein
MYHKLNNNAQSQILELRHQIWVAFNPFYKKIDGNQIILRIIYLCIMARCRVS